MWVRVGHVFLLTWTVLNVRVQSLICTIRITAIKNNYNCTVHIIASTVNSQTGETIQLQFKNYLIINDCVPLSCAIIINTVLIALLQYCGTVLIQCSPVYT